MTLILLFVVKGADTIVARATRGRHRSVATHYQQGIKPVVT